MTNISHLSPVTSTPWYPYPMFSSSLYTWFSWNDAQHKNVYTQSVCKSETFTVTKHAPCGLSLLQESICAPGPKQEKVRTSVSMSPATRSYSGVPSSGTCTSANLMDDSTLVVKSPANFPWAFQFHQQPQNQDLMPSQATNFKIWQSSEGYVNHAAQKRRLSGFLFRIKIDPRCSWLELFIFAF